MKRKEIINQYKNLPIEGGIFQIKNIKSGKVFLGSSLNLRGPWNRLKSELTFGGHRNMELQNDWKELGHESFKFEILETIDSEITGNVDREIELKRLEKKWISHYEPIEEKCYNKNNRIRIA